MTTTITVIAIVALVFFVAISVAVFMIWKQETQMRTDSLKGIEISLNEAIGEISQRRIYPERGSEEIHWENSDRRAERRSFLKKKGIRQTVADDEFGDHDRSERPNHDSGINVTVFRPSDLSLNRNEMKNEELKPAEVTEPEEQEKSIKDHEQATVKEEKKEIPIIRENSGQAPEEKENTDKGSGKVDLSFIDIDDLFDLDEILFESTEHGRTADYNTGRSGKKYTAEELETLIKE